MDHNILFSFELRGVQFGGFERYDRSMNSVQKMNVAVIGSGAAGLAAAWLLSKQHHVTLLEQDHRLGGHANTQATGHPHAPSIDTGFIVYNERCYPNLIRWFSELQVETEESNMSFAVSRENGQFEYAGGPALGLFAQPSLWLRPRYYSMLRDLMRFYKNAPKQIPTDSKMSLGEFLEQGNYSRAFLDDHLMPFAAAIWSASTDTLLNYPAGAFIRFCDNHGLLQLRNRPQWRTVSGGSHHYVRKVAQAIGEENIQTGFKVAQIQRQASNVLIHSDTGQQIEVDHVVIASHADQALSMLSDPSDAEVQTLGAFDYETNTAVLHTDESFMPMRKRAWCSWNYVESKSVADKVCVSYWMNNLQNLKSERNYFVTLNPASLPDAQTRIVETSYAHPVFNAAAMAAQHELWGLQGQQRTWFCGSYFGSGFHEDAVQSGFAVAEQLGEIKRPWQLENPSDRIVVTEPRSAEPREAELI